MNHLYASALAIFGAEGNLADQKRSSAGYKFADRAAEQLASQSKQGG